LSGPSAGTFDCRYGGGDFVVGEASGISWEILVCDKGDGVPRSVDPRPPLAVLDLASCISAPDIQIRPKSLRFATISVGDS
jgi:hypothetical protein